MSSRWSKVLRQGQTQTIPAKGAIRMRRLIIAAASLAFSTLPGGAAGPDQQSLALNAKLQSFATALAQVTDQTTTNAALIAAAGLADIAHSAAFAGPRTSRDWVPHATQAIAGQRLNMRLALTMLSQAYGADGNFDVMNAQPTPDRDALVIRSGDLTLADLRGLLRGTQLQPVSASGPLVLQVPLVIWAGATLRLGRDEELRLSRPDGAFVVNFGHLDVQGGTISSVGDPVTASPHFVPFVTTADGGSVQMQQGHVSGLGFGSTLKFSGFSIMEGSLHQAIEASWVENSQFDNLTSVSISAANDVMMRGNRFRDMRGPALVVSRSLHAAILANVFSGTMPTNAIIAEDGASNATIAGNIVIGGSRTGIVVRNSSTGATVSDNIVWRRDGGGITLSNSDCGVISANLVLDNSQKGIEVRSTQEVAVRDNLVLSNHSAGVWVSAQTDAAQTTLQGNVLAENGAGVAGAVGGQILMDGNSFANQFPQFLSGDLALLSGEIARDLTGQHRFVLMAAGTKAQAPKASACAD